MDEAAEQLELRPQPRRRPSEFGEADALRAMAAGLPEGDPDRADLEEQARLVENAFIKERALNELFFVHPTDARAIGNEWRQTTGRAPESTAAFLDFATQRAVAFKRQRRPGRQRQALAHAGPVRRGQPRPRSRRTAQRRAGGVRSGQDPGGEDGDDGPPVVAPALRLAAPEAPGTVARVGRSGALAGPSPRFSRPWRPHTEAAYAERLAALPVRHDELEAAA